MSDETLLDILAEVRCYLARSDNDFAWSRWRSTEEALADFDAIIRNRDSGALKDLFLPTASLQEVSISSGWGDKFLAFADAVDRELGSPDQ